MSKFKNRKSDLPVCDFDVIRTLPVIGDPQALDCGWTVALATNNPLFRKQFRICSTDANKIVYANSNAAAMFTTCVPSHPDYKRYRFRILFFGNDLTLRYLLEVVAHEVSHLVDHIFSFIRLDDIDTELRAYLLQYYIGEIFSMIDFSTGTKTPKSLLKKTVLANKQAIVINNKDRVDRLNTEIKSQTT